MRVELFTISHIKCKGNGKGKVVVCRIHTQHKTFDLRTNSIRMSCYQQSNYCITWQKFTTVKTYLFGFSIRGAVDRRLRQWLWNYLKMHQQFPDSIIFENIGNQRLKSSFWNALTKKTKLTTFLWSKSATLTKRRHIYR